MIMATLVNYMEPKNRSDQHVFANRKRALESAYRDFDLGNSTQIFQLKSKIHDTNQGGQGMTREQEGVGFKLF